MKIEQISENQIKCTLNRADLASRQIRISELAYGTEKTRGLFQDMMDQAFVEFGFEASDDPLMIEAIPVSMDCIVLMITKVDDPDEIDTDYTGLANINEWLQDTDDSEPQSLFDLPLPFFKNEPEEKPKKTRRAPAAKALDNSLERIYSFGSLMDVITLANSTGFNFGGSSSLFKSPTDGKYYLLLANTNNDVNGFGRVCSAALEYGSKEPSGFARSAFLKEHFKLLIRDKALQNLANV